MFDELQRLRDDPKLAELLTHYGRLGADNRELWQDRVMYLEGVESKELVRLHGELLAHRWVEQNTGATPILQLGVVAKCYRITSIGLRALNLYPWDPSTN